jgi:hypothetical protein
MSVPIACRADPGSGLHAKTHDHLTDGLPWSWRVAGGCTRSSPPTLDRTVLLHPEEFSSLFASSIAAHQRWDLNFVARIATRMPTTALIIPTVDQIVIRTNPPYSGIAWPLGFG